MSLTRREFTALSSVAVALTVLGCDSHADPVTPTGAETKPSTDANKKKIKLATEPFTIGSKNDYKQAVVSLKYHAEKGVFIISDGKTLVALSAMCPHRNCATNYEEEKKQFVCPCHGSIFDEEGNRLEGKADRPLERCAVKLIKNAQNEEEIEVDPQHRFRKDRDEWSNDGASLSLS